MAQDTTQRPTEKPATKKAEKGDASEKPPNASQIELLETKVRFEANGDSRKEIHAVVKINSELGVRQFARLTFDFNRSFEAVEIPLVHITHATGGTADILPSAITDQPNPAVVNAPAYQDVRVKSVRILGLQPGDTLEYRVIKTVSHHPLAPDFWLDHTFDRSGVVTKEIFELDLPHAPNLQMQVNSEMPEAETSTSGEGDEARKVYRWERGAKGKETPTSAEAASSQQSDISITTFVSWRALGERVMNNWRGSISTDSTVEKKALELIKNSLDTESKMRILYGFVSREIRTIDLPLDATGFRVLSPNIILSSGYGTSLDKLRLLHQLSYSTVGGLQPVFLGGERLLSGQLPMPSLLAVAIGTYFVGSPPSQAPNGSWEVCDHCGNIYWVDPALAVAPFGMLRADERGKTALFLGSFPGEWPKPDECWLRIPHDLPFPSTQQVNVTASLVISGTLSAKVKYKMRGDNELVLRVAFHQTAKEKWKELAQLLSITDGFRGQVSNVEASDPYVTKDPFTLDYEIEQPKFVDWSKKAVRIPALLPQLGLPEPAGRPATGAPAKPIDLGTPLDVQIEMSLQLPPGTTASAPTGTSVERDYATYSSQYAVKGSTVTALRHIHFLLREIPGTRAADYNAFLHAVQSDEAQDFTLERKSAEAPSDTKPTGTKNPTPK